MRSKIHLFIASFSAVVASAATNAAPPTTASEGAGELSEVVVTATRETTLLSKTPIAITVVASDQLRDQGITDARSLTNAVPNVMITGGSQISIRGVTSTDLTEKGDPSAAFLFDGIYLARSWDIVNSMYDVGRVEVLRGPQGTLYGRNTTAGVINVISNRPSDKFETYVDAGYGSFTTANVTGAVNVPVGAGLGLRAAVNYRRQDAYYTVSNAPKFSDPYYNVIAGRLSFGGNALDDRLKFVVIADVSRDNGEGSGFSSGSTVTLDRFYTNLNVPTVDPIYISRSSKEQRQLSVPPPGDQFKDLKDNGVMSDLTYDFGAAQLSYLGSYRRAQRNYFGYVLLGAFQNGVSADVDAYQTSHELRLAYGSGSPLHGQSGVYYFHENINEIVTFHDPIAGFVQAGSTGFTFPREPAAATSKAAFSQLTYDIAPDLHLTGGVRYTRDDKSRFGRASLDFPNLAAVPVPLLPFCDAQLRCTTASDIQEAEFSKTSWKVGIDYDVPDLGIVYATVSTGYKAGGFNDGCVTGAGGVGCTLTPAQLYYQPETLTAYEGGLKFRLGGNVRLEAAVFHYDYKDLQVSQVVTDPAPGQRTANAASAKIDGIELGLTVQASSNDRVEADLNWLDARYASFIPDPVNHPTLDFAGKPLDYSARVSAMVAYSHSFPLATGAHIDLGFRTRYSDGYRMIDLNNFSYFKQPKFTKSDMTATYNSADDRYYFQVFGRNLEDEVTVSAASTGLVSSATIDEPRVVGVRAGFKF